MRVSVDRQLELAGVGGEAGGGNPDQHRCGGDANRCHGEEDHGQDAGDVIDQAEGFHVAALVLVFAEDGHEGLREGALGEQPAQQVGQLEGDEEGVGRQSGAERAGDDEVAHEAEDAREQRHAADRGEGAKQIHRVRRCLKWRVKAIILRCVAAVAQLVEQLIRNQ